MFSAIYHPTNQYLIHIDKRAGKLIHKDISKYLAGYTNAYLLNSQNVVWGGYSMVEAELRGMHKLLKLNRNWDTYINLSGQDFPLKSQSAIQKFLNANKNKNFLLVKNQIKERPITLNRIENYFVETNSGFTGKPVKRSYLKNVTPYIGGQWKILTRNCCEFICSSPKVKRFRQYYKHTLIPDESFFQTVLMNTNYAEKIINDDKRAIVWIPDIRSLTNSKSLSTRDTNSLVASGKVKLRPKNFTVKDFSYLKSSQALFARKFDDSVDSKILDLLEKKLVKSL